MKRIILIMTILMAVMLSTVSAGLYKQIPTDFNNATKWTNVGCSITNDDANCGTQGYHITSASLSSVFGMDTTKPFMIKYQLRLTDDNTFVQMFPASFGSWVCADCSETDTFGWFGVDAGTNPRALGERIFYPTASPPRNTVPFFGYDYDEWFTLKFNESGYYHFRQGENTLLFSGTGTPDEPLDFISLGYSSYSDGFWLDLENFQIWSWCEEDWQPQYGVCGIDNLQLLTYYDANACGSTDDLPLDNGTMVACNYCTLSYHMEQTGCVGDFQDTTFPVYDNYASCCGLTGLPEDCDLPANQTVACVGVHEPSDVSSIVTDAGVELGMEYIKFAGLIALVGMASWVMFLI